jgi:hypothetical protein
LICITVKNDAQLIDADLTQPAFVLFVLTLGYLVTSREYSKKSSHI